MLQCGPTKCGPLGCLDFDRITMDFSDGEGGGPWAAVEDFVVCAVVSLWLSWRASFGGTSLYSWHAPTLVWPRLSVWFVEMPASRVAFRSRASGCAEYAGSSSGRCCWWRITRQSSGSQERGGIFKELIKCRWDIWVLPQRIWETLALQVLVWLTEKWSCRLS